MRRESLYQKGLRKRIEQRLPGCFIMVNDPDQYQGIPDLQILFQHMWAMLEVKKSASEPTQPNQIYYVGMFDQMGFGAFIYPEVEEDILAALQEYFGVRGRR